MTNPYQSKRVAYDEKSAPIDTTSGFSYSASTLMQIAADRNADIDFGLRRMTCRIWKKGEHTIYYEYAGQTETEWGTELRYRVMAY